VQKQYEKFSTYIKKNINTNCDISQIIMFGKTVLLLCCINYNMILVWNICVSEISEAEIFDQRNAKTMCIQLLIYYIIMYSMNMGVIDAYRLSLN